MTRLLLTTVVFGAMIFATGVSADEGVRGLLERAGAQYESGDYAGAVENYRLATAQGANHPDAWYNLGNAYYKAGYLGFAVLSYERALRVDPRHADAKANLEFVTGLLPDQQFVARPGWMMRLLGWYGRNLSLGEASRLTSLFYVLMIMVLVAFIFRETDAIKRWYRLASYVSPARLLGLNMAQDFLLAAAVAAICVLGSGVAVAHKHSELSARNAAVVVVEEVPVFSGPSADANVQFRIHEGTRVTIRDARPNFVQIELPGDLVGWVASNSAERI